MKRRDLLTVAIASGLAAPVLAAQNEHSHKPMTGPLANATVSFGFWPPADGRPNSGNRFAVPNAPAAPNGHALLPYEATVKAGGTVNFIVAGFHLVAVYEPGTTIDDIDASRLVPSSVPGLIDDPNRRVYFGIDPRRLPVLSVPPPPPISPVVQDRVEVVQFTQPGRHLVICAVLPHWANDRMHGWVNVLP